MLSSLFGAPQELLAREPEPEDKVSKSEEKSFAKALEALRKALAAVRSEIDKGGVPDTKSLEKARKALQKELAGSALGTKFGALQRLLRAALLELVAAIESKRATVASVKPVLEKCEKELEEALREGTPKELRFWETMV